MVFTYVEKMYVSCFARGIGVVLDAEETLVVI